MDETPVWFEMPGKSTLAERGEKEVRVATTSHEKEKLTVTENLSFGLFSSLSHISLSPISYFHTFL
jgi:hypothetical protein